MVPAPVPLRGYAALRLLPIEALIPIALLLLRGREPLAQTRVAHAGVLAAEIGLSRPRVILPVVEELLARVGAGAALRAAEQGALVDACLAAPAVEHVALGRCLRLDVLAFGLVCAQIARVGVALLPGALPGLAA